MSRNILLVEPGYKTKFPPLGLMKISAYHKLLGDKVKFFKGIDKLAPYEYWDRIYVSTLFTYHWKITIDTIKSYKAIVNGDPSRLITGGILASLMPDELWRATGIKPLEGTLSSPGILDDNDLVIDEMIPDYELFNHSPQKYSLIDDSFFGYSTRGCKNNCEFCGVNKLEPKFIDYKGIKPYINEIRERYGDKPNLVLFDNNILASNQLKKAVNDIIDLGFGRDARFSYTKGKFKYTKQRTVDFNQGTDLRFMTEDKVKLLSMLALNPLRIAFDHIKFEKKYIEKINLVAKYGIKHLSNYILYNFDDKPEDLWKRLQINIELNKKLDLHIYSFPMKYIPIYQTDRSYINEPSWNWQFIRGVQRISNVLKGTIMPKEDFFYRAFGSDVHEFLEILHMPESIILYRGQEPKSPEIEWRKQFRNLNSVQQKELLRILCENRKLAQLRNAYTETKDMKIKKILQFYIPEEKNLQLFIDY